MERKDMVSFFSQSVGSFSLFSVFTHNLSLIFLMQNNPPAPVSRVPDVSEWVESSLGDKGFVVRTFKSSSFSLSCVYTDTKHSKHHVSSENDMTLEILWKNIYVVMLKSFKAASRQQASFFLSEKRNFLVRRTTADGWWGGELKCVKLCRAKIWNVWHFYVDLMLLRAIVVGRVYRT